MATWTDKAIASRRRRSKNRFKSIRRAARCRQCCGDTIPASRLAFGPRRVPAKGLLVKGKLTGGVQRAEEARALAKAGALALSIGFRTRDAAWEKDGTRTLLNVDLLEVSLVSIPANPQAVLTSVKGATANEIRNAVQFERFLKDHGFANSLARRLAAGWNHAVGRQSDDEAQEKLIAALKASAARLNSI